MPGSDAYHQGVLIEELEAVGLEITRSRCELPLAGKVRPIKIAAKPDTRVWLIIYFYLERFDRLPIRCPPHLNGRNSRQIRGEVGSIRAGCQRTNVIGEMLDLSEFPVASFPEQKLGGEICFPSVQFESSIGVLL